MCRLATCGERQSFKQVVKYKCIESNAKSTGQFIKASLHNRAYDQAVDLYEYMLSKNRITS